MNIVFRKATEGDKSFVLDSWIRCQAKKNKYNVLTPRNIFWQTQRKFILKLFQANTAILIVSNPEDLSDIIGYMVLSEIKKKKVIHFMYVKKDYRKLGIAAAMLRKVEINPYEQMIITQVNNTVLELRKQAKDPMKYRFIYMPEVAGEIIKLYLGE